MSSITKAVIYCNAFILNYFNTFFYSRYNSFIIFYSLL